MQINYINHKIQLPKKKKLDLSNLWLRQVEWTQEFQEEFKRIKL